MKTITDSSTRYYALVKFSLHADHFTPTCSFSIVSSVTAPELVTLISSAFISRAREALSYEYNLDDLDEDVIDELSDLGSRLSKYKELILTKGDVPTIESMNDSIGVGYPTFEFYVVAAGSEIKFPRRVLTKLKKDSDFADLRNDEDSKIGSDQQVLTFEFTSVALTFVEVL